MNTLKKIGLYALAYFCLLFLTPTAILRYLLKFSAKKLGKYNDAVKVKINAPNGYMPTYGTDGAACMDIKAYLPNGAITIQPKQSVIIPTGITIELPTGYKADFRGRSGLGFKYDVLSFDGVIDYDFRGKMSVKLFNLSNEPYTVNDKERVAQMEIVQALKATLVPCDIEAMSQTQRGTGGFGSTGK